MKDILQEAGHDVDTAVDGTKAVDLVKIKNYDLVLMDVKMPGISGVDAYKKMKEMRCPVNVVFITAYMNGEVSADIAKEHCDVLYKPVDMKKLAGMIETAPRTGNISI